MEIKFQIDRQIIIPKSIEDCCSAFVTDEEIIPDEVLLLRSLDASSIILKFFPN